MMNDNDVKEMCRKLRPVIKQKADRLWIMYLAEDEKGRRELALDIQIIAEKFLGKAEKQILLPPPKQQDAAGLFYLGDIHYNVKNLYPLFLLPEDFIKQIGIFSITGEGKTNTAMLLALQLLKYRIPFLVVDWKRAWRNLLGYRGSYPGLNIKGLNSFSIDDIQVFTIGRNINQFEWNPFRCPPKADPVMWISTIAEVLEKSHISGMGVGALVNRIYSRKLKELKITSDSTFFPNFYDGLYELEGLYARERELKWKQTALRIFESFVTGPASKVFNSRNPLRLEKLLDKPLVLEMDLEIPKHLRVFFTEIILRWIHLYRLGQGESKRLRHVLFLEEVHNLFPQAKFGNESYSSLENVYRECRGFAQGIISITQHPSLLPVWMLGNCHTQIYLGLQHEADIRAAKQSLFLKYEEQEYLNMLKVGEAIVKVKNRIEPCLIKIPLIPLGRNIDDECLKVKSTPETVKTPSATEIKTHAFLQQASEDKILSDPGFLSGDNKEEPKSKNPSKNPDMNINIERLLVDMHLNPLSGVFERYIRLGINPRYGNEYKNNLISQGMVQPRRIITSFGFKLLFELTQKGKHALRDLGYKVMDDKETVEHKYLKFRIAGYYKNKGFDVLVEEHVNGKPDVIVINGKKKIAVEIETGNSEAILNIEKNLKAGFDAIICVAVNKDVEAKIYQNYSQPNNKVRILSIFSFGI